MNLVRTARTNRFAVYLTTALLFAAGLWAVFQLPSNIYPEVNFPRIMILVHAGDLPPDSVLVSVTRPLEQAASEVQGVNRIRSKTIRGSSEISVLFNPNSDMQYALQLLQGRVNEARNELPADAEIQVERVSPTVFPVFSLILNGDVPGADLRDQAYYVLRPMISRVPGVGIIEVQATDTRQIEVIVDPQKMVAHRLSLPDIADRLKATNEVTSVGKLQKDYLQYLVLTTRQFTTLDQIRNTVVDTQGGTPVHLSDIAEVIDGVEDRSILVTGNGKPAALINISRQIGGNILQIGSEIESKIANLGDAIPKTLHLSVVYDLAQFVRDSIGNVRDAILIGALLAVLILFVVPSRRTYHAHRRDLAAAVRGRHILLRKDPRRHNQFDVPWRTGHRHRIDHRRRRRGHRKHLPTPRTGRIARHRRRTRHFRIDWARGRFHRHHTRRFSSARTCSLDSSATSSALFA